MVLCREWSLVKHQRDTKSVHPLCCRSWTCNYCAPRRKRGVRRQVESGKPNKFITVTLRAGHNGTVDERVALLSQQWRNYIKTYKRKFPTRTIEYFAVVEFTKAGEPHLHIAARSQWIDQKEISAYMLEHINSPVVSVMAVRSGKRAALYVSKYVAKSMQRSSTCKRYWKSQRYCEPRRTSSHVRPLERTYWEIVRAPAYAVIGRWKAEKWEAFTDPDDGLSKWRRCTATPFSPRGK